MLPNQETGKKGPAKSPESSAESVQAKTREGLGEFKEVIAQQHFEGFKNALLKTLNEHGEIPQEKIDRFVKSLSPQELQKVVMFISDKAADPLAQKLRNGMNSLQSTIPGNRTELSYEGGAGAQKVLKVIEDLTKKGNPLLEQLAAKFHIKPENISGLTNILVGLAAKFVEGLAASLKGMGMSEQILTTARDLRVTQLKKTKNITKKDIDIFIAGYNKWMEDPIPGKAPDTVKKAAEFLKVSAPAPAAAPAQPNTAVAQNTPPATPAADAKNKSTPPAA